MGWTLPSRSPAQLVIACTTLAVACTSGGGRQRPEIRVWSRDQPGIACVCVSVMFRADGLPPGSHLDYWREVLGNVFMPIDLDGEFGPEMPAEMRTAELGPI